MTKVVIRRKFGVVSADCPPEVEKAMERGLESAFEQTKAAIMKRRLPKGDRKDGD